MFGKVKCSGCGVKLKKQDLVEVVAQCSDGQRILRYCIPCITWLDSEMKIIK